MREHLPRGWAWATPDEIAAKVPNALTIGPFGSDLKVPDYRDQGVPLVFVREIRAGRFGDGRTKYVEEAKAAKLARHYVRPGDLLITKMGDPPGDTAVYPLGKPPAIITADCIKLTPNTELTIAEFLRDCLLAEPVKSQILEQTAGVAQQKLSLERFRAVRLPVPPLNEQRRIVAKLEALQARSRRARAALDAVPPLLEKLRQSILAAAFRGDLTKDWRAKHKDVEPASELLKRIRTERRKKWEEAELAKMKAKGKAPGDDKWKAKYKEPEPVDAAGLPELPEGWCWATVEEITGLITSGSRGWAEYYAESGPIFIRSQDINSDILSLREVAHVQVPANTEGARTRAQQFDLLITITGANVTRCAWVAEDPGEAYVSQHVALVRPVTPATTPFLHLWVIAETGGRKQLKKAAYGLGKPGLNLDDVATILVPLPPVEEQAELVSRASSLIRTATSTESSLEELFARLRALERATLAKAFRGELVPQDPNDEPAEAMLARVRGQNGANAANGAPNGDVIYRRPKKAKATRAQARS